jgi:DNA repair protein RecO (recombination protein O)
MLQKTRAIVLNIVKYGESGLIVQLFTENFGRQSFIIHGIRKKKGKFNYLLFEPLSLLDLDIYYKETRNLQTLKEAKQSIILHRLPFDIKRSSIAIFLSEILYRCLREIEPNKLLFNYLFHAIQILDMTEQGVENFHLIFLIQLSKFLGIYPKNNTELYQYKTTKGMQLIDLLEYSLQDIGNLKIERTNRLDLLDRLIDYYRDHLEGLGEIKSLQVLHEVFL